MSYVPLKHTCRGTHYPLCCILQCAYVLVLVMASVSYAYKLPIASRSAISFYSPNARPRSHRSYLARKSRCWRAQFSMTPLDRDHNSGNPASVGEDRVILADGAVEKAYRVIDAGRSVGYVGGGREIDGEDRNIFSRPIKSSSSSNIDSTSISTTSSSSSSSSSSSITRSDIDAENYSQYPLRHVAYIVDGNGRWAINNNKTRMQGHNLGANVTVEIVKESFDLGIQVVTLYLFSTENWKRSNEEILNIMFLLEKYLRDFSTYLKEENIRIRVIGQRYRLSDSVQLLLKALETSQLFNNDDSFENQRTLCLAVSYGGRDDIIETTKRISELVATNKIKSKDVTEEMFSRYTMTGLLNIPDPDIIIRTSGESRLSNFLLWQSAYTEFEFVDKLWPEFTSEDLRGIVRSYKKRKRRFGGIVG